MQCSENESWEKNKVEGTYSGFRKVDSPAYSSLLLSLEFDVHVQMF